MVRRSRKKRVRRGPRQVSLISLIELYALTDLATRAFTGYSPLGFVAGGYDIGRTVTGLKGMQ